MTYAPPRSLFVALGAGVAIALAPAKPDLVAADSEVLAGRLKVRVTRELGEPSGWVTTVKTIDRRVSTPDSWSMVGNLTQSDGMGGRFRFLREGRSYADVQEEHKISLIGKGTGPYDDPGSEFVGLTLGPCLPLGRGFSLLKEPRSSATSFEGSAPDGARIVAHLVDGRPQTVDRVLSNNRVVRWTFSQWQRMNGVWMPATVVCEPPAGGVIVRATYEIEYFDPDDPAVGSSELWFTPGYRVLDNRVSPPIGYTFEELLALNNQSRDLSLARLLEFSEARAREFREGHEEALRRHAERYQQPQRTTAIYFAIAGMALVGIVSLVVGRRLLRRP